MRLRRGPFGEEGGVGEWVGADAATVVVVPDGDLFVDETSERVGRLGGGEVDGFVLGPFLHPALDLGQRGWGVDGRFGDTLEKARRTRKVTLL